MRGEQAERAPTGLARLQAKAMRCSGGSDSGSTNQPKAALIRQAAAETQNGRRGSRLPSRPPIAGPTHEAQAEGHADQAEGAGAVVLRGDVGDIGEAGADRGRGDARDHPADEQQGERRRHRHEHVVEPEPEAGDQDHRPAAVAVAHHAEQRREEELHQRPDRREDAEHLGGAGGVAAHEAEHDVRQHRDHQPQRQHVQRHRAEDEGEARAGCSLLRYGGERNGRGGRI